MGSWQTPLNLSGITLNVNKCTIIVLSLRVLLLYCGLRLLHRIGCKLSDFSGLIVFIEYKKVILKLQQPVWYHPLMSSIAKHGFCLQLQFLSDSITQPSETSLLFPVYNLTATLLDCMQRRQCCLLLNRQHSPLTVFNLNVEQAREAFHAACESLFAMIEQLQMPHTTVYQALKLSQQLQQAG